MKTSKKPIVTKKKNKLISKSKSRPGLSSKSYKPDYRSQILVHFKDNIQLPYNTEVSKFIQEYNAGPWAQIEKKYPGIKIEPLFSNIKPEIILRWMKKAKEMDPTYKEGNFLRYFKVICPVESNTKSILDDLSSWNNIKNSYIKTKNLNPAIDYSNDLQFSNQGYLNAAPVGIGVKETWDASVLGSDGNIPTAGFEIRFIDIETGWKLDHEDLLDHGASCLFGTPHATVRAHGTSVLGIVCAKDNTLGCVGIAPNLGSVDVISHDPSGVASSILESLNHLRFGDVLLIEATNVETYGGVSCSVPVETTDPEYDAIRLATALGIVVVESGGNGNGVNMPVNFDNYKKGGDGGIEEILNSNNATYFRDSGAIIVTASHSACSLETGYTNTHAIMPWAPFGERLDCYAWGENITSLSTDITGAVDEYINNFEGTSGSAAIIAGTLINMQAMVFSEHGYKFSPLQIREILRNPVYGTQLIRETGDPFIPVEEILTYMPDLQKFVTQILNLPPDLYLRDNIDDTGEPHAGAISTSPDIILRNTAVVNPTLTYGPGSGTENNIYLSETAKISKTNYIYFRVLNQGGMDASDVKVNLYYSVPSTLLTPSLMNYIGEVSIPNVPAGEILTVSSALEWVAPGPEAHYCFVALVSNLLDPVVDTKKLKDWDWSQYCRFISENNNITWRNFNMELVPAPVPPPPTPEPEPGVDTEPVQELPKKDWKSIKFISPGLPNRNQKMSLQVISNLPKNAKLLLQAPQIWKKEYFSGNPFIPIQKKNRNCFIPVKSSGKTLFENINFKMNEIIPFQLYINLPDKYFKMNCYTIAIKQILDGKEIGRITWKLGPPFNINNQINKSRKKK